MKFMGSKRWMLNNGLAKIINDRIVEHRRFVDLFSGSAAVACHVATRHDIPVLANDLQQFSRLLAASVICRTSELGHRWLINWIDRASRSARADKLFSSARKLEASAHDLSIVELVSKARAICKTAETPITAAYGGYYFSPWQAIQLDHLRHCIPNDSARRFAALGALIQATSACAASPGHTAQPFSPTKSAGPYLRQAWSQDVIERTKQRAVAVSGEAAKCLGKATIKDANVLAGELRCTDLVFVDPPYSSVHYSRFYHVLESIAIGGSIPVSGTGRYPPRAVRPRSRYSVPTESQNALYQLLRTIADRGCGVLVTFPAGKASNGLCGDDVISMASEWFSIDHAIIESRFSTLGGNSRNRSARMKSEELLLSLNPIQ